jgi:hypothetical protein
MTVSKEGKMSQQNTESSSDKLYRPVTGGGWKKSDSAPSLADQQSAAGEETSEPFPDTAVADDADKSTPKEEFSERLDDTESDSPQ